jgi:murein DD-endopeptidase MepM/ murein hydrolase activator NlpD
VSAGALLALALGAELWLQPGNAHPGDVVLVTVSQVERAPSGSLGGRALRFYPHAGGWQALAPVALNAKPGPLPLSLVAGAQRLEVALEVLPAAFRHRTLTLSTRFERPSVADQRRAAADQRAFVRALARPPTAFRFTGNFAWPRHDILTAPFGDLRLINGQVSSQHLGLDQDGEPGDPVEAANDGEVVLARACFASGNTVLLFHGGGLFTAYFHLSKIEVTAGQTLRRGQRLGLVGATGRVTGPHLHFGAKLDGQWVNPESLLALRFAESVSDPSSAGAASPGTP